MTTRRFRLADRRRFLGGRAVAHRVRLEAEDFLRDVPDGVVVLDFSNVEGISHSFADELLSPLSELLGERVRERVFVEGADEEVAEILAIVARMHRLWMPTVRPAGGLEPAAV
jgi:hypothetical protein